MVIRLTFDTNCILRDKKDKNKSYYKQIKKSEELEKKGLVEIYKTDVQDTEIGDFPPRLEKSQKFEEQMGIGVFDHSRFDHCVFAGEEEVKTFNELKENQKPTKKSNDIKDIMILHTHKKHKNDFLITHNIRDFVFDKDKTSIINPDKLDCKKLDACNSEDKLRKYLESVKE